jgi:hypothetical protein
MQFLGEGQEDLDLGRVHAVTPAVPQVIIIDNRQCILPAEGGQCGQRSVSVFRESSVVAVLQKSFTAAWRDSVTVELLAAAGQRL